MGSHSQQDSGLLTGKLFQPQKCYKGKKPKNGQRTEENCAESKRAGKNTRHQDNGLEFETKWNGFHVYSDEVLRQQHLE